MKKEYMKKHSQSVSGLFALQSSSITQRSPLGSLFKQSPSGLTSHPAPSPLSTHSKQSPTGTFFLLSPSVPTLSPSGLTRGSRSNQSALLLSADSRVKPENDTKKEGTENDRAGEEMAATGLGKDNMKRTFSVAVLTLCSLFFLSESANAACYDKTCADMGYTLAAGDCESNGGMVKCPFDTSKVFCIKKEQTCQVGDIYYSDGSCAEGIVSGKTAVGVVGYVKGTQGFAISLTQTTSRWSTPGYNNFSCISNMTHGDAPKDMDGKAHTDCIMREKVSTNTYPAVDYCYNLKPVSSGKGSSGWYLPAAGELVAMSPYQKVINEGLARVSNDYLFDKWYWSSTEADYPLDSGVFSVDASSGTVSSESKSSYIRNIRCLLAI